MQQDIPFFVVNAAPLVSHQPLSFFFFFFFFFSMTILQNAWIQQIASIASYMMYPD